MRLSACIDRSCRWVRTLIACYQPTHYGLEKTWPSFLLRSMVRMR
jgi:hypothetical protein